jgi:hypothetical protein
MQQELLSLMPKLDFTRRDFVVTSLAAGFAASLAARVGAHEHLDHATVTLGPVGGWSRERIAAGLQFVKSARSVA